MENLKNHTLSRGTYMGVPSPGTMIQTDLGSLILILILIQITPKERSLSSLIQIDVKGLVKGFC